MSCGALSEAEYSLREFRRSFFGRDDMIHKRTI